MRVLIVGECPWTPSSLGKVSLFLSRGLSELGFRVCVACFATTVTLHGPATLYSPRKLCAGDYCKCMDWDLEVPVVPWLGARHTMEVAARYGLGSEPDAIVVVGTPYGEPLASALADLANARSGGSLRAPIVGYFPSESMYLPQPLALTIAPVTVAVFPTRFVLNTFESALGAKLGSGRLSVVWHGIDPDWIKCLAESSSPRKGEWLTACFVGKNHVRKDLAALILGAALATRSGARIRLLLVTTSFPGQPAWNLDFIASTVARITGIGVDRVREMVAVVEDPWSSVGLTDRQVAYAYASSHLHALPTNGEAFGMTVLEAAALGVPTIMTAVPALEEVWKPFTLEWQWVKCEPRVGGDGLVLCHPDPSSIAEALHEAYSSPSEVDRAASLAEKGARRRELHYLSMARGIADAIDRALRISTPIAEELAGGAK